MAEPSSPHKKAPDPAPISNNDQPPTSPDCQQPLTKRVYFVKEAQSISDEVLANQPYLNDNDPNYIDCLLSDSGSVEARGLQNWFCSVNPDLVITSPLRRSLEMAKIVTENSGRRVLVKPECTEQLVRACDIGTRITTLRLRYPSYNFPRRSSVMNRWWWSSHFRRVCHASLLDMDTPIGHEPNDAFVQRVRLFKQWLARREEECIVVFTHARVISMLTEGRLTRVSDSICLFNM